MISTKKTQRQKEKKSKWRIFFSPQPKKIENFSYFGHINRKINAEKTCILFFED